MSSLRTTGLGLVGLGCALPVLTYGAAYVIVAMDAANGGPPNQGLMLQAFLALIASFGIGVLLIISGAVTYACSFRRPHKRSADAPSA